MFPHFEKRSIGITVRRKLKTHSSLSTIFVALLVVAWQSAPIGWLTSTASAQSSTATIYGTVLDPERAVVPDVHIAVTNVETSLRRETMTDKAGYFVMPLVSPVSVLAQLLQQA